MTGRPREGGDPYSAAELIRGRGSAMLGEPSQDNEHRGYGSPLRGDDQKSGSLHQSPCRQAGDQARRQRQRLKSLMWQSEDLVRAERPVSRFTTTTPPASRFTATRGSLSLRSLPFAGFGS